MDLPPLEIFPLGLSSSVITTVWIGVMVVAFFNLRLGWVLSGLVVPGYLVPLLLINPWSAAVITLEAVVTYLLVYAFSEHWSRFGFWSGLFGRDRFFALVLTSVAVRLVFDGWLLPWIGAYWAEHFDSSFDYRNNLHSFGLVIIALMANQFWKPGLLRGLIPLVVTVGITYLIVRYGLLQFTNFNVGQLGFMYEDLAASILASPKAYIVLLTTAFIASRMNLLYGWDFNGILIPSLLALQWYQPSKILTSFGEALLILLLARLLLATPLFARTTMEGARKLVFFFNIGFGYKLLLAYALSRLAPELKVTDAFAFGYLLSTLIAMRMHEHQAVARLTRASLQTSLVAVAVASAVGFGLTLLPLSRGLLPETAAVTRAEVTERPDLAPLELLQRDQLLLYQALIRGGIPQPLPGELTAFENGVRALLGAGPAPAPATLRRAAGLLAAANYELVRVAGHFLYLRERQPVRGWGLYLLDPRANTSLLIEVPAPLDERGTLEAGLLLRREFGGHALAIAGSRRFANPNRSSDVLDNRQTIYQSFHRLVARADVLQVRGYTPDSARTLAGLPSEPGNPVFAEPPPGLWIRAPLPQQLDLARLRRLVGKLAVTWGPTPLPNLQRSTTPGGFAELRLDRAAVRRLLIRAAPDQRDVPLDVGDARIDSHLQEWLLPPGRARIAARGTNRYQVPELGQLLFLDEQLLTPLLQVVAREYHPDGWTATGRDELRILERNAATLGYRLTRYRHRGNSHEYLILAEDEAVEPSRYWGTYVFRLGADPGYLIEVPRPLYESYSLEFGITLFEELQARALLIAGAHPRANLDGNADPTRFDSPPSLFGLVNQVLLREAGDHPLLVISSRAFGRRDDGSLPDADAFVAFADAVAPLYEPPAPAQRLLDYLDTTGLHYRIVAGAAETAGYEAGGHPQSRYLRATDNQYFGVLWLSPLARAGYRRQDEDSIRAAQFEALGLASRTVDLIHHLTRSPGFATPPPDLIEQTLNYVARNDILQLRAMARDWPDYRLEHVLDRDSRLAFLLIHDGDGRTLLAANLAPRQPGEIQQAGADPAAAASRFITARAGLLLFRDAP